MNESNLRPQEQVQVQCPKCRHDWSRHTGRHCSARDTDASGNYDVCDCIEKAPPAPVQAQSEPLITKNPITGEWWIVLRDCGESEPIGPFDTREEAAVRVAAPKAQSERERVLAECPDCGTVFDAPEHWGRLATPEPAQAPVTVTIPAKDVAFMSESYRQSLLDQGKVLACPLPAEEAPVDEAPKDVCGECAASMIPRLGMYFACVLPKGHEGEHRAGGSCIKHGKYIMDAQNVTPQCPHWPDCIKDISAPSPAQPHPESLPARKFTLPDAEMLKKMAEIEARLRIPLDQAARTWSANEWNNRASQFPYTTDMEMGYNTALSLGEDLYKTLRQLIAKQQECQRLREQRVSVQKFDAEYIGELMQSELKWRERAESAEDRIQTIHKLLGATDSETAEQKAAELLKRKFELDAGYTEEADRANELEARIYRAKEIAKKAVTVRYPSRQGPRSDVDENYYLASEADSRNAKLLAALDGKE